MNNQAKQTQAFIILISCVLFNLTIGVLYAWSVFKTKLTTVCEEGGYGWSAGQAGLPYSICIIVFAVSMLMGGRLQDKNGPRRVATVAGILTGMGLIICGLAGHSILGITLGFGVVTGCGMGIGYGCVNPPVLKWFPPDKKGLVSGLVVGGYGLAAVYYAPLATMLLSKYGINKTFIGLGLGTIIISTLLAQLIKNPPEGYNPIYTQKTFYNKVINNKVINNTDNRKAIDYTWTEMLKTTHFRLMFFIFVGAASVGVMFIGNMTNIAYTQLGISNNAVLAMIVSLIALTNSLGRMAGGRLSDKIGRTNSLFVVFTLQMFNMAAFASYKSLPSLFLGIIFVGFCFGTLISVMPALCADLFGLKNFGHNYGILFLAWGFSGITAPVIADLVYDTTGNFNTAYIICSIMMGFLLVANWFLKRLIRRFSAINC